MGKGLNILADAASGLAKGTAGVAVDLGAAAVEGIAKGAAGLWNIFCAEQTGAEQVAGTVASVGDVAASGAKMGANTGIDATRAMLGDLSPNVPNFGSSQGPMIG